ncbi:sigma-54-dependent Fis family transcriptional regulator [Parvularcula sp. ZS-1/3]|uniref:Sigma-54-dependent Fis family transcriptional regulator n=1 Tax=Parvularcula mediterranea TaxID=2732508 RepID=A0A7Y3RN67_9PROT|nr:sigma-54 dependent transcriptional regulator [Parvularcula mediterranea]NNU17119.1 sigma-54-dependent Fis family transcriptional regulator [Parvularcula mediterranea]
MAIDVLIVDDEPDIRDLIAGIFEDEGFVPHTAANSDDAFELVAQRPPALVILDIWLQGSRLDGLGVLDELRSLHPGLPIVIISGHGTVETAIAAIKKGAYDFLEKPLSADRLVLTARRALERAHLQRENRALREKSRDLTLIGKSPVMAQLRSSIERIAQSKSRVLIEGPVGSGRELVARTIHARSDRADRPFVVVSAAAIEPDQMEESLFGIEGDDGRPRNIGLLEQAHGGTLLFQEVGDMPIETQSKILRVLIDQSFKRLGGSVPVNVDVRIISTSSEDLLEASEEGSFRKDLFHRLSVVGLKTPSLGSRREDIPALAEYFLDQLSGGSRERTPFLSQEAMAALQAYNWPGNVRQLRNVLERTIIMVGRGEGREIAIEHLPDEIIGAGPALPAGPEMEQIIALPLREARERFEREYLLAQIGRFGGNISKTAGFVGMERSALHRKLKALGIGAKDIKPKTSE